MSFAFSMPTGKDPEDSLRLLNNAMHDAPGYAMQQDSEKLLAAARGMASLVDPGRNSVRFDVYGHLNEDRTGHVGLLMIVEPKTMEPPPNVPLEDLGRHTL